MRQLHFAVQAFFVYSINSTVPVNNSGYLGVLPGGMSSTARNVVLGTGVDSSFRISDCRAVNASPDTVSMGEVSLVLAARGGDRAAFGALYARFAPMVHGILLAKIPPGDVEDLLQDVFLRALPRLGDLRDVSRFGPWLAAIARNRANDYHRELRPIAAVTDGLPENESELPASKASAPSDTGGAAILSVIRALPDAYRETLILRLVEGMSGPEIAARTGLTHGSVRVNLHRGMLQLREKLNKGTAQRTAAETTNTLRKRNAP